MYYYINKQEQTVVRQICSLLLSYPIRRSFLPADKYSNQSSHQNVLWQQHEEEKDEQQRDNMNDVYPTGAR